LAGKQITDRQVRRYMEAHKEGYTRGAAAARSGFSERTGRRIGTDPVLPSQRDRTRRYRTRQNPFIEVWREELAQMGAQGLPARPSADSRRSLRRARVPPMRYLDKLHRPRFGGIGWVRIQPALTSAPKSRS
jgi:hypothetical protein